MGIRNEEDGQEPFQKRITNVPQTALCAAMSQCLHYMLSQRLGCESTFEPDSISILPQGNLKKEFSKFPYKADSFL